MLSEGRTLNSICAMQCTDSILDSDDQQRDFKMEIKEEPWSPKPALIVIKPEESSCIASQNGMLSDEHSNAHETDFKMKVKEEPLSSDISFKSENCYFVDVDMQDKKKEMHETAKDSCRLYTDTISRNSDTNSGEHSYGSIDLEASQHQVLEEHDTDSQIGDCNYKAYKCKICGMQIKRLSWFKRHCLTHDDVRPYKCDICAKSFTLASNLKVHKLIHVGKRAHTCGVCSKSFSFPSHLKAHTLIHEEDRKQFNCDTCGKVFLNPSGLRYHKLVHEGAKPHMCDICSRSFRHIYSLRKHKAVHQSRTAHTCELCDQSFMFATTLKSHKLSHKGETPYTCDTCNASFPYPSGLRRHQLIHGSKRLSD